MCKSKLYSRLTQIHEYFLKHKALPLIFCSIYVASMEELLSLCLNHARDTLLQILVQPARKRSYFRDQPRTESTQVSTMNSRFRIVLLAMCNEYIGILYCFSLPSYSRQIETKDTTSICKIN